MRFLAQAPANIALVKYMGKRDFSHNIPANPSLSLTLNECCTAVEIEVSPALSNSPQVDINWIPEDPRTEGRVTRPFYPADLDAKARDRAIQHVRRVHDHIPELFRRYGIDWDIHHHFKIRTANTFPQKSGLASSASSFAALTLCTAFAAAKRPDEFIKIWSENPAFKRDLATGARRGSGSSCRSFEGPWVVWEGERAEPAVQDDELDFPALNDLVLLINPRPKKVGSSEAHARVMESPLWHGREARASRRVDVIRRGLLNRNLAELALTAWEEMWEMHSLFHTAPEPFTYWEPESVAALKWLSQILKSSEKSQAKGGMTPPIVTMDAGPNVHILVPTSEAAAMKALIQARFPNLTVLEDRGGNGASLHALV
jgi:diphosphomevalonate decarboxylase